MNNKADHRLTLTLAHTENNWFSPAYACTNLYNHNVLHSTAHSTIGSTLDNCRCFLLCVRSRLFFHHVVPQNEPRTKYTRKTPINNGSIFSVEAKLVNNNSRSSASFFWRPVPNTHRTEYDSWSVRCTGMRFLDLSKNNNSKNCGIEPVLAGYWNSIQRDK